MKKNYNFVLNGAEKIPVKKRGHNSEKMSESSLVTLTSVLLCGYTLMLVVANCNEWRTFPPLFFCSVLVCQHLWRPYPWPTKINRKSLLYSSSVASWSVDSYESPSWSTAMTGKSLLNPTSVTSCFVDQIWASFIANCNNKKISSIFFLYCVLIRRLL